MRLAVFEVLDRCIANSLPSTVISLFLLKN